MGTKADTFFDRVSSPNSERVSLGEVRVNCTDACDHGRKVQPYDYHWETATINNLSTYGCWEQDKTGNFIVPEYCSGSDYSGSLVEVSNMRAFRESFKAGEDLWWTEVSGGHGTFALVIDMESIPDSEDPEDADEIRDQVVEWLNALASYPLADESLHSELETEAQNESYEDWGRKDFIRAIEVRFEVDLDDLPDFKTVDDLFYAVGDRTGTYWINEQGDSMYFDIERLLNDKRGVTRAEVDQLLAETVPHVDAVKALLVARHQVESLKGAVKRKHAQVKEATQGASELAAVLEALGIDALQWEQCKARRTLPDGKPLYL